MNRLITLGYAGLLPFIALPLLYLYPLLLNTGQILNLYCLYSALILGFMAGILWPVLHDKALNPGKAETMALLAVMFPVLSFGALLFGLQYFLLCQAGLFVLLRLGECRLGINRYYSSRYRSLRNQLTLIVLVSHLSFSWLVRYNGF